MFVCPQLLALLLLTIAAIHAKEIPSYQTDCVTLNGTITFNVTYIKSSKATGVIILNINDNPTVTGTCESDSATMGILYNHKQWFNLTLTKNADATNKVAKIDPLHWGVTKISLDYTVNTGDQLKAGDRQAVANGSFFVTPINKSYSCSSEQVKLNVTDQPSEMVMLQEEGLQLSFSLNDTTVYDYHYCKADQKIKDIVPIAVGCALAALVLIVLIAYLIGRRRTVAMGGYERV